MSATSPGQGLRTQALRSMMWNVAQNFAVRVLSLVTFVVLAKLLDPRDFGIAAVAEIFAVLVALLTAGGFSGAIVQRVDLRAGHLDAVFVSSVSVSLVLSGLLALAARPIADAFDTPELAAVLWATSPLFVAIGVAAPHMGLMQREFRFAVLAKIAVVVNTLATSVGIAAAFAGAGYWSLVVQTVMVPVLTTIIVIRISGYKPGGWPSRNDFREIYRSSVQFLGASLTDFFSTQSDKFVVGRQLSVPTLGLYSVAYRAVRVMLDVLAKSLQVVALPVFARLQTDPGRLHDGFLAASRLATLVTVPTFVAVGIEAEPLVRYLFGEKWLASAPVLQLLCVYGALQTILTFHSSFLEGVGRAGTALRLSFFGAVLQVALLLWLTRLGLTYAALALVIRGLVELPISTWLVRAALPDLTWARAVKNIAVPVLAATVMILPTLVMPGGGLDALTLRLASAGILFWAVMLLVGREHVREAGSVLPASVSTRVPRFLLARRRTTGTVVSSTVRRTGPEAALEDRTMDPGEPRAAE